MKVTMTIKIDKAIKDRFRDCIKKINRTQPAGEKIFQGDIVGNLIVEWIENKKEDYDGKPVITD